MRGLVQLVFWTAVVVALVAIALVILGVLEPSGDPPGCDQFPGQCGRDH